MGYHACARLRASEYGISMIRPRVHLNIGNMTSACGTLSMVLTDESQAVTCPSCISAMELQPA